MAKKILELDIDASGAITSVKSLGDELEKVEKTTKDAGSGGFLSGIEKVSPRAAGAIRGVGSGIQGLVGGFKSLRVAIMATGIGALVVLLTSVVLYFTKTKRGAELLERVMAGVGAAVNILIDAFAKFGEKVVNAFSNPQKALEDFVQINKDIWEWITQIGAYIGGAFTKTWLNLKASVLQAAIGMKSFFGQDTSKLEKQLIDTRLEIVEVAKEMKKNADAIKKPFEDAADAARKMWEEMVEAGDKATALTNRNQKLRDSQRALNVETARARARIKELNMAAEDTTLSIEERIAKAKEAGEIEENLMNRRLALAAENVRIIKEQNSLSESLDADLDKLADAEIELANIRMESSELQTTLQNKYNTLVATGQAQILEAEKKTEEERLRIFTEMQEVREALVVDAREKELMEFDKKTAELFLKANGDAELLNQLEETRLAQRNEIRKKFDDEDLEAQRVLNEKKLADAKALEDSKWNLAQSTANAIGELANLIAGDDEKRAKKAFAINKALNLASAVANTYRAVTAALAESYPAPGMRFIAAATAGVTGLANVAKIAATKFGGGAGGGISSGGGGGLNLSAPPNPTAVPQIGLNFGQQNQQAPIPAYVIGSQVQNDMEARTRVSDLAKL
jgi:hypothetical protein